MPDVPLCLVCKLRLLRYLIKNVPYKLDVHTQQFSLVLSPGWRTSTISGGSYKPKMQNVKTILQSHPIDVYCSVGKNAHYSVVYGCFKVIFDQKPFDMLMIADPWEFGPGICDFETFVYTGKYKRTGRRRELPNLHWNASLVA